jgi:hypothetical protein
MYFWLTGFVIQYFSQCRSFSVFGVGRFDYRFGSGNIGP